MSVTGCLVVISRGHTVNSSSGMDVLGELCPTAVAESIISLLDLLPAGREVGTATMLCSILHMPLTLIFKALLGGESDQLSTLERFADRAVKFLVKSLPLGGPFVEDFMWHIVHLVSMLLPEPPPHLAVLRGPMRYFAQAAVVAVAKANRDPGDISSEVDSGPSALMSVALVLLWCGGVPLAACTPAVDRRYCAALTQLVQQEWLPDRERSTFVGVLRSMFIRWSEQDAALTRGSRLRIVSCCPGLVALWQRRWRASGRVTVPDPAHVEMLQLLLTTVMAYLEEQAGQVCEWVLMPGGLSTVEAIMRRVSTRCERSRDLLCLGVRAAAVEKRDPATQAASAGLLRSLMKSVIAHGMPPGTAVSKVLHALQDGVGAPSPISCHASRQLLICWWAEVHFMLMEPEQHRMEIFTRTQRLGQLLAIEGASVAELGHHAHALLVGAQTDRRSLYGAFERLAFAVVRGRVLPGCSHLHCTNMAGFSEAELPTRLCDGCKRSRYCSEECQRAAWAAGHAEVCGAEAARRRSVDGRR